jgi:hypothetical protein
LQISHALGSQAETHWPVVPSQLSQAPHVVASHTPVAGLQVWQVPHAFAWHTPPTQVWHVVQMLWQTPVSGLHCWQGPHVFALQVPFTQVWHVVQVLTQLPLPSQVWQGPHLLLHTPPEHTWHCLPSQHLLPHLLCPTGHCWHTPLVQLPLAQSLFWVHWALTGNEPGSWHDLRRSVSLALVSRQMGWTPRAVLQQSVSTVHR